MRKEDVKINFELKINECKDCQFIGEDTEQWQWCSHFKRSTKNNYPACVDFKKK